MPALPEDIATKQFSITYARGYDKREVEEFLGQVAEDYAAALEKMAELADDPGVSIEGIGEQVKGVLRSAKASAQEIVRTARDKADEMLADANRSSEHLRVEAEEDIRRNKEEAFKQAQQAVIRAEDEARSLREQTDKRCSELIDEAISKHSELLAYERSLKQRAESARKFADRILASIAGGPHGDKQGAKKQKDAPAVGRSRSGGKRSAAAKTAASDGSQGGGSDDRDGYEAATTRT